MTLVLDKVVEDLASKAVNKLVQTVAANIDLVSGIGSAIEDLTSDIETFNARLVDVSKNQSASDFQVLRVAVKKFRSIVNKAQDAVAKYIALKKRHEDNALAKCFHKIPVPICGNINVCASEIQSIRGKMKALLQTHEQDLISLVNYQSKEQDNALQLLQPVVEEGNATGFEDQVNTIKARLMRPHSNLIVIPIVGMPGTGKTTFASQIFHSTNKLNRFGHTIWVHVSQSFDRKQKYIDILCEITKRPRDEYSSTPDNDLLAKIRDHLKDKKYFIVLDDIWEKNDWDSLKEALPKNSQGSRVLVTTRFSKVVDSNEDAYILKPLDDDVSWTILEKIVFGKDGCHHNDILKPLGKGIAKRCNGLPLSLVMVGGILRKSRSPAYWKRVAENPFQEINRKDKSYHKVARLSYDHLGDEKLRNCFLYFASFPMGQEIAALKLIRLWIAEEFIPTIDEWGYTLDLEVEAENYLKDLVDRNLVMVMKRSADGQIKTCRIHDSLHEFCKTEAAKNDLFHIIDGEQKLDANTISSHRRLCFHSSSSSSSSSTTCKIFDVENNPSCLFPCCYNKMNKSPYLSGEHVHSLLLSSSQKSSDDIDLKLQEDLIAIPNAFPLLRVLDIESFKLSFQLPNELFSLNLLRYLAITIDINILLPKAFKNLRELQTLVIKTKERTTLLEINGGIWNMEKLRHLHTNASMQLPFHPQKRWQNNSTGGKTNIRTLSSISPRSCQKEIFSKTPHLKKLGVRGNLAELLLEENKQEICLFNNLQMLKCLENLKLYGQNENALKVPMLDKFALRLRKLTFYKTFFKWDEMRILGLLEELEVLKLDENAFRGESWDLKSDVVFNQLQYLRIGRTNLKTWTIMENSFPVLENLVLRNCTNLEAIPLAFANVHSLKVIELYHMSENVTNSARDVAKEKRDRQIRDKVIELYHMSEDATNSATEVDKQMCGKVIELYHMSKNATNSATEVDKQIRDKVVELYHMSENATNPATEVDKKIRDKVIELYHMSENATNSTTEVDKQRHDTENVKGLDLKITPLQPKATAHYEQTHGEENVNTSGFNLSSSSIPPPLPTASVVQEDIVVGFDNEVKIIKDRLTGGSFDLTVISIVGMAGLGKSTIAKMVFNDVELHYEFFTRIWVYVSSTFSRRQVFLDIISQFTREDYRDIPEELLAKKIREFLKGGKYFIVMDDVWTVEGWDCLKIAFPNNMKGSRVLITTRASDVASHADSAGCPHHLKFLSYDESWELLEKKVFHKERFPPMFDQHGKSIARRCNGLPLALLTIGRILGKDKTLAEWKRVAEDPLAVINQENQSYHGLVRLSYNELPSHLKNCFLYLAVFPIGHEIPAWKLIRLWIAEGFILAVEGDDESTTSSNLEVTAEKYLSALVDRNLLFVLKRKADGQIKTCRLHDTLHEYCKSEAANANLFHVMEERAQLEVNINPHRLCIHSSIRDFLGSKEKPSSKDVCSFLSFCSQRIIEIPKVHLGTIPKCFPLLRVIDVESLNFESLPKELFSLYQLRYLAISTVMKFLPGSFNKFEELQTLVFNTSQTSLEVKANLWSIPKLRHVHTNSPMQLPPPPKNKNNNSEIQILSTISPSSCTRELVENTPNLQKLGIRGDFGQHMEMVSNGRGTSLFDNLHKLECLEHLKLINEAAIQHNQLLSFPSADKFPRKLRKMTLRNTRLNWKDMSILGSLDELEVLKLDEGAFLGEECDVSNIVFKRLQYLRIQRTDLVSWIVSKDSFRFLEYLILCHCTRLDAIPSAFGEVESLKVMELFCTNRNAADSAREIHKPNRDAAANMGGGLFQLSIYPPDH